MTPFITAVGDHLEGFFSVETNLKKSVPNGMIPRLG